MKSSHYLLTLFLIAGVVLTNGCTDKAPSGPTAGLGGVTVKKYVAIGNSLTAGYQSNGLYESAQIYSYPNLIAQQLVKAGASIGTFEQPLWPDPGTPDLSNPTIASRYRIISLNGPIIGQAKEAVTSPGPENATTVQRPYDNLGIPGIPLAGFMDTSGTYQAAPLGPQAILRWQNPGSTLPKSVFQQVQLLQPDLITFWLGANDVLGYAASGGVSPSAPTNAGIFEQLYTQALVSLRASFPNAKIVVSNIPDVQTVPFFTTLGPTLAPALQYAHAANPAVQGLCYQKSTDANIGTGFSWLNTTTGPLITLKGSAYASLLGRPTGQWYRDLSAMTGIPVSSLTAPPIDTTQPFGFDPHNPWPNALVLDSTEQVVASNAVAAFNLTIASVAAANNAVVFDANALLRQLNTEGYTVNGNTYTSAYISGGAFSLDGVHPSDRGYGIVANEIIKLMNARFGMSIPLVDVNSLPGISAPLTKFTVASRPIIPLQAFKDFDWLFRPSNQ